MLEVGDEGGGARPVEQLSPLEALVVTQSICVRTCTDSAVSRRHAAWKLQQHGDFLLN